MNRRSNVVLDRALEQLRHLALTAEEGALIGSEDQLMTRLEVSRPTLRQAGILVMQEGLLAARPGTNGGYFATRPTPDAVTHMAAIFLDVRGAGLHEIIEAIEPIRNGAVRLAARNDDPFYATQLRDLLRRERELGDGAVSDEAFMESEREFNDLVERMSANRVLGLFTGMLLGFTQMAVGGFGVWSHSQTRIQTYRKLRNRMAEAILEGDEEIVTLTSRRAGAVLTEWLMESVREDRRSHWRA